MPAEPLEYYAETQHAIALINAEKWADAEAILRRLTAAYPLDSAFSPNYSNWGRLAMALRKQGKYQDAIAAYSRSIEIQGNGGGYASPANSLYWIAVSHAALGNTGEALATLHRMISQEKFFERPNLSKDVNFKDLWTNPEFVAIAGDIPVGTSDRVAGWRADIDYLAAEFSRTDPLRGAPPPEFLRRAEQLKTDVPKLNDYQVALGIGNIMATLHRGHTALWLQDTVRDGWLDFRPLPVRLYIFPEGLFITEAPPELSAIIGGRVLAFDGTPAEEAIRRVMGNLSRESVEEGIWQAPSYLVRPGVLKGLDISASAESVTLTVRTKSGAVRKVSIKAGPEWLTEPWRRKLNAPPNVPAPLFLSDVKSIFWARALPEQNAVYAQVNNMVSDKQETLPQFGLRLRALLAETGARNLILDLRHNNGGNSFLYTELLRTVIQFSSTQGNQVYALIGRNIYSAAGNFSSDLDRLAHPIFVGEPTGNTGNQWGDESMFTLPFSKISGSFSGVKWQLTSPWDQRHSIVPNVPVQLSASAYFAGRDPVLETVFAHIKSRNAAQ